ncbi:DUF2207 domain-containing protein [Henriciella sp. AS95]|uniref:DUF2207 domain-containing protein n=1 Tax=Henriciella sp. AS95 TaxID=3135782 RepID=UPI003177C5D0
MLRFCTVLFIALWVGLTAMGEEVINRFDVGIEVERDGDIIVTETINLTAENYQISRGIFRDLPRYYTQTEGGDRLRYDYRVMSVRRDGRDEPYETSTEDNAWRIRIGNPDVILPRGEHVYVVRYRVKNQIRYHETYDELYWNVTGSYWAFPILTATAEVRFPDGVQMVQQAGYTGGLGEKASAYRFRRDGDAFVFETTEPLARNQGLTIAVGIEKGMIDPPSTSDKTSIWWQLYGSLAVLMASLVGVFIFLYRSWDKVGRDPPKGPVFARYEAPKGYSPAAVHHIYHRGFSGHDALIATLVNLGVKGFVDIDAQRKTNTVLTPKSGSQGKLPEEEALLDRKLFSSGTLTLGDKYNASFTSAYTAFRKKLSNKFGSAYFKWNLGYTMVAIILSAIAIVFAIRHSANWSILLTGAVIALALLNGLFMYLMPAATPKGQKVRSEIEGFKLYLEKAEKLQLNAAEVGTDRPPPMTKERYETFLPYAIALGVEEPWTKHFEKMLPKEAEAYNPAWAHMAHRSGGWGNVNRAITSNISSAVTSSMPKSSGSSGSGGGGFSGGGGGGGGGGGW